MYFDLTGNIIESTNNLQNELESLSINDITITKITGHLDEVDGGDIEVKFSNEWSMMICYYNRSRMTVFNQIDKKIFEDFTVDCFSGLGLLGDIRYGLASAIKSVLNVKQS